MKSASGRLKIQICRAALGFMGQMVRSPTAAAAPHRQTHGGVDGAALPHQSVQVGVRDLVDERAVVGVEGAPVLGHPDAGDPLVELALRVHAQVADVLGVLGLNLGVLDPEAVVGGRFEFALPAHAVVHLLTGRRTFNGHGKRCLIIIREHV